MKTSTPGHDPAAFVAANGLVTIYKAADLEIAAGEMLALVGASGSGKSTLLNVLGGLGMPTAGALRVGAVNLLDLSERERVAYKRKMVGFVWQQKARNLLPLLLVRENVEVPLRIAKLDRQEREARSAAALESVGLAGRMSHLPYALSGGEQQRVALARALVNTPESSWRTSQPDNLTLTQDMRLLHSCGGWWTSTA